MAHEILLKHECPRIKVSEAKLKKIAARILSDLGFKKAALSVLLVDGPEMRRLNRRYLRHAWSTDVLAFSEKKSRGRAQTRNPGRDNADFLGDIALCLPTIRSQAKEYEHTFEEELHYCLCHGILHLMGYEDKNRKTSKTMHRKQGQILKRVKKKSV
ncbi:MAG TPA: rRNA maturation RNase YbeY [Candidatus Omnitrophota bacterium]|nr:rRNA maturation RNase YbeY [Candidatus Omnitrophota bacterium]HRY85077.1 rRNA maturation RNase YbeY [Candidatus Omnitrophota bacterium]